MSIPSSAAAALKLLDDSIWTADRIFATRLIILDSINADLEVQSFIEAIARRLPQEVASIQMPDYRDNWLELVAHDAGTVFMGGHARPATLLEQWFNDLNAFGLRESIAYLYDIVNPRIDAQAHLAIQNGYVRIIRGYLQDAELVTQRMDDIWDSFAGINGRKWRGRFEPPHRRMIAAWRACSGKDGWSDGFPQEQSE